MDKLGLNEENQILSYVAADVSFDDMIAAINSIGSIELNFYIYDGKLACVYASVSGVSVGVEFQGGDYRTQNMVLFAAGQRIKISGETSGDVETRSLSYEGTEYAGYTYDKESGDLKVTFNDGYTDYTLSLSVKKEDGELHVEFIDLEGEGSLSSEVGDLKCEFVVKKGEDVTKLSGDVVDLGSMSESEFTTIFSEVYTNLLGTGLFGYSSFDY